MNVFPICGRQDNALILGTCNYVALPVTRGFADGLRLDLEMGRGSWISDVGPIESHQSSKAENLSWLRSERET